MRTEKLQDVKKAFAHYLSRPEWNWSWFLTQTFDVHKCGFLKSDGKPALHSEICRESFNRMMRKVADQAMSVYGFGFAESHRNGRPHWHAILHVKEDLFGNPCRTSIYNYMYKMYGRNQIRGFKPSVNVKIDSGIECVSDGVSRYLCKYIAKESHRNDAWWDFKGFLGGLEVPTSEICQHIGIRQTFD